MNKIQTRNACLDEDSTMRDEKFLICQPEVAAGSANRYCIVPGY
ncbi:hypothetical protein [Deminuibacter soli]|nr:hypothetical protein [Deminuibacter soli]